MPAARRSRVRSSRSSTGRRSAPRRRSTALATTRPSQASSRVVVQTSGPAAGGGVSGGAIAAMLAGAAALGGLAYFALRPRPAAATPFPGLTPGLPGTTPGFPTTPGAPVPDIRPSTGGGASGSFGTGVGVNGPDPSPALVARLRSGNQPRLIFGLQALAYEYNNTNAVPDGIEGPITQGIIRALQTQAGLGSEPATTSARAYQNVRAALFAANAGRPPSRVLPFTLPQDVINSVNATILAADPSSPLLQVRPQLPAPAAQAVMPYQGYGRPGVALPMNAVGSNPGYGVMVDPNGLNIGLWQSMQQHAPLGTGWVAADVNAHPVAGQHGGYWAGWR